MRTRQKTQASNLPWGDWLLRFSEALKRQKQTGPAQALKNDQYHTSLVHNFLNMKHDTVKTIIKRIK